MTKLDSAQYNSFIDAFDKNLRKCSKEQLNYLHDSVIAEIIVRRCPICYKEKEKNKRTCKQCQTL